MCDNKRQSEMRGKCDFLRFIYIPFSLQHHFEVKREEAAQISSSTTTAEADLVFSARRFILLVRENEEIISPFLNLVV